MPSSAPPPSPARTSFNVVALVALLWSGSSSCMAFSQPHSQTLTPPYPNGVAQAGRASSARVAAAPKPKWLALSQNFPKLSAPEQAKLHSRMSEWVALSPQQRTAARLNFGETQQISPDDKKAKWEAYQALSPEEKRKLAAGAAKPPATAAAVKPVTPEKMANMPTATQAQPRTKPEPKTPRIATGPGQLDPHTLLPQQPPGAAGSPLN